MHPWFLQFLAIAVGAAFAAVLGIVLEAKRINKDPSDYGPRALVSQFLVFWFGFFFFYWSLKKYGTSLQWVFFGISMVTFYSGWGLSSYFASRPEAPEGSDNKLTGFKSDVTSLHLE